MVGSLGLFELFGVLGSLGLVGSLGIALVDQEPALFVGFLQILIEGRGTDVGNGSSEGGRGIDGLTELERLTALVLVVVVIAHGIVLHQVQHTLTARLPSRRLKTQLS